MRRQKGFTLVELLTVISIIVLLMAILLPALNGVRRRARAAVCLSNLRQWGMVYKMYTDEFDGKLPRDYGESPWYYPIRNYYRSEKDLLLCPSAKKPSSHNKTPKRSKYGDTFAAWEFFSSLPEEAAWNSIGSYGLNGWTYKLERKKMFEDMNNTDIDDENSESGGGGGGGTTVLSDDWRAWLINYWRKRFGLPYVGSGSGGSGGIKSDSDPNNFEISQEDINDISKPSRYWLMAYEKQANNIPLIFDSSWLYSYFDDTEGPPPSDNLSIRYSGRSNTTCIDRHNGGINMVFMDFSASKVGLKELWTLKWHRQFNIAGTWTQLGGMQPEQWPKWLRKYKDY